MKHTALFFSALLLVFCNCANKDVKTEARITADGEIPPVETEQPNTNYKPAFTGQTRIAGVKTSFAIEVKTLTKQLENPWGIAPLPDGRLLITQKKGTLRLCDNAGNLSEAITGLPKVDNAGQGGLLGITIDPGFATNRMVYWVFSEGDDKGTLTAVAKGRLANNEKTIENATVIYRATPRYDGKLHYGGRIVFDSKGMLIISTGERSDLATRPQAQLLNSSLGKIIRITTDGKAAPGNPFSTSKDARPELYSYGHRNVQGLAIHPVSGELWENEFGPRGGDEVNRILPGKNYGWPTITYGIEYGGDAINNGLTQKQGLEQPVYYWDPVTSPSGMTFYNGKLMPEWENNLFIGGLSSQHIIRLVIQDNKVVGEERLLADQNQRFRDVAQGTDGALYAVTDEGRLYQIAKNNHF